MAEVSQHGALAVTIFGGDEHGLLVVIGNQQRNHRLIFHQTHAAHATGATAHRTDVFFVEPDSLAGIGN